VERHRVRSQVGRRVPSLLLLRARDPEGLVDSTKWKAELQRALNADLRNDGQAADILRARPCRSSPLCGQVPDVRKRGMSVSFA
jgi:hypothetical protein